MFKFKDFVTLLIDLTYLYISSQNIRCVFKSVLSDPLKQIPLSHPFRFFSIQGNLDSTSKRDNLKRSKPRKISYHKATEETLQKGTLLYQTAEIFQFKEEEMAFSSIVNLIMAFIFVCIDQNALDPFMLDCVCPFIMNT